MPNGGTKRDHDAAAAAARRAARYADQDPVPDPGPPTPTAEDLATEAAEIAEVAAAVMSIEERRTRIVNLLLSFMDTRPGAFTLNRATLVQDLTIVADRLIDIVEGRVEWSR